MSPTTIFSPASTPARLVFDLSLMVWTVTGAIFVIVVGLLIYALIKFRKKRNDNGKEPPQVYGSKQIELAWTIIPILIVLVLFLSSARVIAASQRQPTGANALDVNVVAHQFWWEYRYPGLRVVTANELHLPASDPARPTPTRLHLYSADTVHSFWVPRLAGKTDLVPNFPNDMWLDPETPGLYLGQCAQYCGAQHAKMLLRVYVQSRADFERWVAQQKQPAVTNQAAIHGREVFETTACVSCHTIAGTTAAGRFGPDLTHLMSRDTLASGIVTNTRANLRRWIEDPSSFKPASLMPAMGFTDSELDAVTDYLMTLR
jgi:cytochrome c oxidase subunit II